MTKNAIKNVIIYARVSTDEQAEKGYSLPAQVARVQSFCQTKNYNIVRIVQEDYTAWKGFDRPAYNELKNFIRKFDVKVDYILFTQWSRFSREATASLNELARLKKCGIEANAVEQWIEFSVPEAKFPLSYYLMAPQVENERLSLRVKVAIRQGLKEGRWMRKAPFGYLNDKINKLIIPHPTNSRIVQFCFDKFGEGIYSGEEVRRMGKERGLKLTKQAFLNLLKNPVYIGRISIPATDDESATIQRGLHDGLISEELFNKVQKILRGKKKSYKGNSKSERLPLKGHLICPKCGKIMTGSGSRGRKLIYHYYHCQRKYGCNNSIKAREANENFEKYLKTFVPKPEILELYTLILEQTFMTKLSTIETEKKELELKIAEIDIKIQRIDDKYLDEAITDAQYRKLSKILEEEKSDLVIHHATLRKFPSEYEDYLKWGLSLVGNLSGFYQRANVDVKGRIIGSIFPEKLIYENNQYRTAYINSFIELLFNTNKDLRKNKSRFLTGQSSLAPQTGLEPVTL